MQADDHPDARVLFVAEKPSVAAAVADALSGGRKRVRGQPPLRIHDFYAFFKPAGRRCSISVTSVVGHVFGLDFDGSTGRDIRGLYGAKVRKIVEETSEKLGVLQHLRDAADGVGWLCLWLDCDREGENICFEVLKVLPEFSADRIWRASFSAVTELEVHRALQRLVKPNACEAAAVDARQELDLKVGCSFTRLLTRALRDAARRKFGLSKLRLISYGPCQTPTLFFCVERQREIDAFVPKQFWELCVTVAVGARDEVELKWSRNPCFDGAAARRAADACRATAALQVGNVLAARGAAGWYEYGAPAKLASNALGLSPHRAMEIAESLYTSGFISYPHRDHKYLPPLTTRRWCASTPRVARCRGRRSANGSSPRAPRRDARRRRRRRPPADHADARGAAARGRCIARCASTTWRACCRRQPTTSERWWRPPAASGSSSHGIG